MTVRNGTDLGLDAMADMVRGSSTETIAVVAGVVVVAILVIIALVIVVICFHRRLKEQQAMIEDIRRQATGGLADVDDKNPEYGVYREGQVYDTEVIDTNDYYEKH